LACSDRENDPVPGECGNRTIVEAEAAIVQRIFAEYVAGRTPRDIAIDLNREHVPPPRGDFWSASTIHGNSQPRVRTALQRPLRRPFGVEQGYHAQGRQVGAL
jgi:hypothetical protein